MAIDFLRISLTIPVYNFKSFDDFHPQLPSLCLEHKVSSYQLFDQTNKVPYVLFLKADRHQYYQKSI